VTPSRWALAALAGVAVLAAACSNNSNPPATTTTTTTSHHVSSTTTTTSSTTTTTVATTTSSSATSTTCAHITASAGQSQGAAGTITGVITVTNTGPAACSANGYPTVALYSGSHAPLTVTMVNGLSVDVSTPANAPPSPVSIAPSGTAQFAYQYSDVPSGSETSCPQSEVASVTMPGASSGSATFTFSVAPCDNGTIRVSPVYS
jgi:hypothetical protein